MISCGVQSNNENEGRVEISNFVFNDVGDVKHFLATNAVPSAGIFWDLFSTLVSMTPKWHKGKERADEVYSSM